MSKYFVGLDLGQSSDPTALCILERVESAETKEVFGSDGSYRKESAQPPRYNCTHLERLPLGTLYPAIVEFVGSLLATPEMKDKAQLVIDATGVGRPVCDMFKQAGLRYTGVTITGGDSVNRDGPLTRVPKRILVSTLQVLLQSKRLDVAQHELQDTLIQELLNFRVTITEAANDTYAGRTGAHDDLVLAVALAAWKGEAYCQPIEEYPAQNSYSFRSLR